MTAQQLIVTRDIGGCAPEAAGKALDKFDPLLYSFRSLKYMSVPREASLSK